MSRTRHEVYAGCPWSVSCTLPSLKSSYSSSLLLLLLLPPYAPSPPRASNGCFLSPAPSLPILAAFLGGSVATVAASSPLWGFRFDDDPTPPLPAPFNLPAPHFTLVVARTLASSLCNSCAASFALQAAQLSQPPRTRTNHTDTHTHILRMGCSALCRCPGTQPTRSAEHKQSQGWGAPILVERIELAGLLFTLVLVRKSVGLSLLPCEVAVTDGIRRHYEALPPFGAVLG